MRPVGVVVIDVLVDQPEMTFADDQHPVQALAAGTGDPAFRNRVRAWRLLPEFPADQLRGRGCSGSAGQHGVAAVTAAIRTV
jgi:hypothetical protein